MTYGIIRYSVNAVSEGKDGHGLSEYGESDVKSTWSCGSLTGIFREQSRKIPMQGKRLDRPCQWPAAEYTFRTGLRPRAGETEITFI